MAEPGTGEGKPVVVDGYILTTSGDRTLNRNKGWGKDMKEGDYVFSREEAEKILTEEASEWKIKPEGLIPATWDGTNVEVTGEEMSLKDLLKKKG